MVRTLIVSFVTIVCCVVATAQPGKMDYPTQWKKIDELKKKRLPQSVLEEVQEVYRAALDEKEYGQAIKAIIYRMDCQGQVEENTVTSLLDSLKQDVIRLPQPAKSIVYSLMADVYKSYCLRNYRKIKQRTHIKVAGEDMDTWDIGRLLEEAVKYYQLSIRDEKKLQETPLDEYSEIVVYTTVREEQEQEPVPLPTLYDFLATKVIQSYNGELSVVLPQQAFRLNQPAYFADAAIFAEYSISTTDTLSVEYQIISIYQKLLRFRLQQPDNAVNRQALVNIDIERLQYVHANGRYADVGLMYENALKALIARYEPYTEKCFPLYALAVLYKTQAANWREKKDGRLRSKYKEAYKLCEQIVALGNSQLTGFAKELQDEIKNPSAILKLDYMQYPGVPILTHVSYRNTDQLYLYIYRLTDEEAIKYHRQSLTGFSPGQSTLYRTQTVDLLSQPDHQQYSTEIKIDGLPQGVYAIFASDISDLPQKEFKKHDGSLTTGVLCQVSPLSVVVNLNGNEFSEDRIRKTGSQAMQVRFTDSKTGEPVKNGKIDYYCGWNANTMTLFGSYTTDEYGLAYISQEHDRAAFVQMIASRENERFLFYSGFTYVPEKRTPPARQVVFFTDRSIYRPGQTVYYKALCFDQQQLVTKFPLVVEYKNMNGKVISSQEHTTNDFGTVQGSFTIPQGSLNGLMSLACKMDGQDISTFFRVEEYKRPTFEVICQPVDKNYRLNDSVHISGKARALAEYAVDHARLSYRVVRNEQPRSKWWWIPETTTPQREIASGTAVTQSDGSFTITFKAEADDIRNGDRIYNYMVTADITDVNGETRSATQIVKISNKPLLLETSIPQNVVHRDMLDFDLMTTNLNGDPTPADVSVTLSALKNPSRILRSRLWTTPDTFSLSRTEFEKYFPLDVYDDEDNPEKYPVVRQLSSTKINTAQDKKIQLSALKTADAGWYQLDIKARNPDGIEVEDRMFIQLAGSPAGKNAPIASMKDWLTIVKDKGEPGENIEFLVAGGNKKTFVYYEVLVGASVVERKNMVVGTTPQRLVIPIKEAYRGGFTVNFLMMQNQRLYTKSVRIGVSLSDQQLDIRFTSFRNQLEPGEKEKWTLTVKNKQGEKEMAEMVATLYDASLDALSPYEWATINPFYPLRYHFPARWQMPEFPSLKASTYLYREDVTAKTFHPLFPKMAQPFSFPVFYPALLPKWGDYASEPTVVAFGKARKELVVGAVANEVKVVEFNEHRKMSLVGSATFVNTSDLRMSTSGVSGLLGGRVAGIISNQSEKPLEEFWVRGIGSAQQKAIAEVTTRQNFNETAFFYPQLRTDENGGITIEFTIPEALTRWKMLGFAHTKDFKVGNITNELITQKQVAISANAPRFFRENDVIEFTAKVNNITQSDLTGQAMLRLYDATNMQPVDAQIIRSQQTQDFSVKEGESTGLKWTLAIPADMQAITYKITAQAGNHTDGEEKTVPVLTNAMLVTETMPFSLRGGTQKKFTFKRLKENQSNTLRNHRLTLEFTSNPAWYAVQAMPYMMEYPYECAEQVFTRFYSNSLAATIANSSPRIQQMFDQWRTLTGQKEALLSSLEKNQELKQVMQEETPWVMQAATETERKKRVGLLFDLNRMGSEQQRAFDKLQKMLLPNGGFPWFDGLPASRFITQHILAGLGHLQKLNALGEEFTYPAKSITGQGFSYLDDCIREDYDALLKTNNIDLSKQHITPTQLHYLYACSFSDHQPKDKAQRDAFEYYCKQTAMHWMNFNLYSQAMAALVLSRYDDKETAADIIRSLKERALHSEEMGMYWKDNTAGYFWHQAPIETQAMLIEAFNEVVDDKTSVEEMKIWLLRNKQTDDWRTTKATAEACYALLITGDSLLDENHILDVKVGGEPLASVAREDIQPELGTGYVKTSWSGSDVHKDMALLEVNNPNTSGIAWGGMYWQYFEQLDKITGTETNLRMNKQLFLKKITGGGAELLPLNEQNIPKVGDVVTVRMELRADRDYEYVHLKDMRAAGFESAKTISGYRYQDGLWYYENIKDASTNFFIPYLRKGTYVFEYELRVTHAGQFSNGITTFQCMYAPEFNAHSEGVKVKVE